MISSAGTLSSPPRTEGFDRLGVLASVLCAIHCAAAPLLLLAAPAFGRAWAHPASHWIIGLLVVPLAAFSLYHGRHRSPRWVKLVGTAGVVAIIIGAALPYLEAKPVEEAAPVLAEEACTDSCCPSIVTSEEGETVVTIPPASIVTTLGGLFLIGAHIGNLRSCRKCPAECCETA